MLVCSRGNSPLFVLRQKSFSPPTFFRNPTKLDNPTKAPNDNQIISLRATKYSQPAIGPDNRTAVVCSMVPYSNFHFLALLVQFASLWYFQYFLVPLYHFLKTVGTFCTLLVLFVILQYCKGDDDSMLVFASPVQNAERR